MGSKQIMLPDLPDDVIGIVVEFLPAEDMLALQSTNRHLRHVVHKHITSLSFDDKTFQKKLSSQHQSVIASLFPNLRNLKLYNWFADCTDGELQRIAAACPELRSLHITGLSESTLRCNFGDDGLTAIASGCLELQELVVQGRTLVPR